MTDQERENLLTEARQFYIAAPILGPLLERFKKNAMDKLMGMHRDGKTEFGPIVAELAVITNIQREIASKHETFNSFEEKKR